MHETSRRRCIHAVQGSRTPFSSSKLGPKWRAAGWFGVDPPHLIRLKSFGRSSGGGVGDAEDGEGVAVREVGALQPPGPGSMNVPAPAGYWAQHVHNCLPGGVSVEITPVLVSVVRAPCAPWREAVRGNRPGPGRTRGPSESGGHGSPAGSGGDVIVKSGPSESGRGRGARPERREHERSGQRASCDQAWNPPWMVTG